jgi:hypothetical protein
MRLCRRMAPWLLASRRSLLVVGQAARMTLMTASLAATVTAPLAAQQGPRPGDATFVIVQHGTRVGTASSSVTHTVDGWTIEGATRLTAPLDVTVRRVEVEYTDAWKPLDVTVDLATGSEGVVVHGGGFGSAKSSRIDIVRGGRQVTFVKAVVSPDVLILPNFAYAAYEALAARLDGATPGTRLRAYVIPQREIPIRVDTVTRETLRSGSRTLTVTRCRLTFLDPSGQTTADIWTDGGRLARLDLPSQDLSVIRSDLPLP